MECKCKETEELKQSLESFNRYIVECKLLLSNQATQIEKRFNRYIVECKWIINKENVRNAVWF